VKTNSFIFINGQTSAPQHPFFIPSKTGKKEYHGIDYEAVLKEIGAEVIIEYPSK
jgi:hypothetical protein